MPKGGLRKKLIMGMPHSIRPNKDYVSKEAIDWANEDANLNEVLCRALEMYYRSHNGVMKESLKNAETECSESVNIEVFDSDESVSTEVVQVDKGAMSSLNSMLNSVKR